MATYGRATFFNPTLAGVRWPGMTGWRLRETQGRVLEGESKIAGDKIAGATGVAQAAFDQCEARLLACRKHP